MLLVQGATNLIKVACLVEDLEELDAFFVGGETSGCLASHTSQPESSFEVLNSIVTILN
jgi:hypothetical protein